MKNVVTFPMLIIALLPCWVSLAVAAPDDLASHQTFVPSAAQQKRISDLTELELPRAFRELQSQEFLIDRDLRQEAVFNAFHHRKEDAVAQALNHLAFPRQQLIAGRTVNRLDELSVAKAVFEAFPEQALGPLMARYRQGDGITRGNIIYATAGLAATRAEIKRLFIQALDDRAPCEEELPETDGEPLRVCDAAYNQLVFRFPVKNLLRTIGTSHAMEVRDEQIGLLKSQIAP